jgi:hypothetical protein
MNREQLLGPLRNIVAALLGYFVAKGWLPPELLGDTTALAVAAIILGWSYFNASNANIISKAKAVIIKGNATAQEAKTTAAEAHKAIDKGNVLK